MASKQQPFLFAGFEEGALPKPMLRRQSLHLSDRCGGEHMIPWNKSFDAESCVYRAAAQSEMQFAIERLPNRCGDLGMLEAVRAPYQRSGSDPEQPDVLFFWRHE